ncbi:MAG: DUF1146 family protein [Caldibacillus sp.]
MLSDLGISSLLNIVSHLLFIGLSWWALQALDFERFLRKNRVAQARLLYLFLAITIGSAVSNFFLDYLFWTQRIPYLFP